MNRPVSCLPGLWKAFLGVTLRGMTVLVLTSAAEAAQQIPLPPVMHFCGVHCFTLLLNNGRYVMDPKSTAARGLSPAVYCSTWTVESFTESSVIIHRHRQDTKGDGSPGGYSATYTGQIPPEGNRLVNGSCCGQVNNNMRLTWGSALDSLPGADAVVQNGNQTINGSAVLGALTAAAVICLDA